MAYDEKLAQRVRDVLSAQSNVEEKKMFGGICYMVSNNMCCGVLNDTLMARVGPEQYEACLKKPHAREMDFTGKALRGMVYVGSEGIRTKPQLTQWIDTCLDFIGTLPPKKKKG